MTMTAGGHPVHAGARRVAVEKPDDDARPKVDALPLIERYIDISNHIHKTAVVPRRESFLWACSCGAAAITGGPLERARLAARSHILREAEKLFEKLEGRAFDAPEDI